MSDTDPRILDVAFLSRQTDGDAALERELLRLLLGQCDLLLPLLISDENSVARSEAAHGLRGAAAGLGAARLVESLSAIEEGRRPDLPVAKAIAELRLIVERRLAAHEAGRSAA